MVDISSQNNKINVTVSSSGNTANTNVTPDYAQYYSEKSKEWAISNRIVDNIDYSSKYYANESKKQADISTAKTTEVVESGNTAVTNIESARDNAITNVNTAGATQVALATEQATIATNKASEVVESGNTALSNIDTAKNNAITTITTQETTSKNNVIATGNEQVERVIATGNNYDNLTHRNITNCLLEVPQRIKLELNDGVLTLKAGSQVIIPNGFEADGTTPKFDYVDIKSDLNLANGTGTEEVFFIVTEKGGSIFRYSKSNAFSGSVAPTVSTQYACWYDTTNNILKYTNDTGATWVKANWGLPIGIGTTTSTSVTSIDQIFNGMGYIGSTVWVDKGVKGLIPNGRNEDGSLKNIERTTTNLIVRTLTNQNSDILVGSNLVNAVGLYSVTGFVSDEVNNINTNNQIIISKITATKGVISNFQPKLPFRAVDYNDKSEISGWGMPSNKYINLTLGANGSTYTAPANGYYCLKRTMTSAGFQRLSSTIYSEVRTHLNGGDVANFLPIKKGNTLKVFYDGNYSSYDFRFVYAEGSK